MLAQMVESYIALRRALGFSFTRAAIVLRSFARFASERGDSHVSAQTAIDWSRLTPSIGERDLRLKTVVRFARHAHAEDPRHEVPPADVFCYLRRRPVPYIFSQGNIMRLIAAASQLGPRGSLRPHTYSTLFALLVSAGLRISEALALRLHDLTPDGLLIRQTKFRKSRLVPLHETAVEGLNRYLARRGWLTDPDDHLFVDRRGRQLRYDAVNDVFLKLVRGLGLYRAGCQPVPRLHSLRHTFAVRALQDCPSRRDYVERHLLALSTYMGHVSVLSTYWYLEAAPELMRDISTTWEAFVKGEAQ